MNSVGIDLHRKRSHIAALDEHGGELFSRRIVNDPDTFVALLGGLDGESKVALEATYGWAGPFSLFTLHAFRFRTPRPAPSAGEPCEARTRRGERCGWWNRCARRGSRPA